MFTCLHCNNNWSDSDVSLSEDGEPELLVVCPFCMVTHSSLSPKKQVA